MKKISEVAPQAASFPDAMQVEIEQLLGKTLEITGMIKLESEKGEFLVIECRDGGILKSFTCGGKVVMDKLDKARKFFKQEFDETKLVRFNEPVGGVLKGVKNSKGQVYYDLVDD